jgi:quercetin dioxygenase-like cupin family protein
MQIWSVDMEAVPEHLGTAQTKYMIAKESFESKTEGTYLGLACVFEVAGKTVLAGHTHPTHEFWFVTEGSAVFQVDGEARTISVGDLVYTPPNTPHQLRNEDTATFRAFAFALSYPGQGSQHTDVDLEKVEPS